MRLLPLQLRSNNILKKGLLFLGVLSFFALLTAGYVEAYWLQEPGDQILSDGDTSVAGTDPRPSAANQSNYAASGKPFSTGGFLTSRTGLPAAG
jgi:hypothetical protein